MSADRKSRARAKRQRVPPDQVAAEPVRPTEPRAFEVVWTESAIGDYGSWARDRGKLDRINVLVASVVENPFSGIGKPEPLPFDLKGCWSRRIDHEHRLVYGVQDGTVTILQARTHYSR